MITLQEIQDLRDKASSEESKWLEQHGWNYTSATETSVWLWEKTIKGKTLQVSASMAIEIETRIGGCPECGSDEIAFENPKTGSGRYTCQECGYNLTQKEVSDRKLETKAK